MRKRMIAILAAWLALQCFACAEVYSGVTTALSEIKVCAEADGVLEHVYAEEGAAVKAGDLLAEYQTDKFFASQDGRVAALHCDVGDQCGESVLEIMPMEKYRIYCTVDSAYSSPECMIVHSGEQLYIKCTANGTHRGIGIVTNISESEYDVLTVGGEFHAGETVYLYRDAEFSTKQRVGIGTVVENDVEKYEAEGTIVRLHVSKGEEIERGEILFETVPGRETGIYSTVDGIVSSVDASVGESVQKGQVLASVVPKEKICAEISVNETAIAAFHTGARVKMIFTADRNETPASGTVIGIADVNSNGLYRILIAPDETDGLYLGMTLEAFME